MKLVMPLAGDAAARIEVLEKQKAATDHSNRELLHDKRQLEAQAIRSKVHAQWQTLKYSHSPGKLHPKVLRNFISLHRPDFFGGQS